MMSENEKHRHIHQEKQPGLMSDGRAGREKLLDASEISLVLDTYDDIFSDFDPRPYDHRSLSQDFLTEAKHAARDKISGLELKFLIPKALQDAGKEGLIELRLREHFEKHAHMIRQEITSGRLRGIVLVIIGMFITVAAAALGYFFSSSTTSASMTSLLEPVRGAAPGVDSSPAAPPTPRRRRAGPPVPPAPFRRRSAPTGATDPSQA